VHDEHAPNPVIAALLAQHPAPGVPTPIGVFRAVEAPTFDREVTRQQEAEIAKRGPGTLRELLEAGDRWQLS
jgi:2-oxoglutarate ferredoxin oxidoreductase subunit beta